MGDGLPLPSAHVRCVQADTGLRTVAARLDVGCDAVEAEVLRGELWARCSGVCAVLARML